MGEREITAALRRLRPRRRAVRDAHRRAAVHRLDRAGGRGPGGDRERRARSLPQRHTIPRARRGGGAHRAREAAGRPVRLGGGVRRGAPGQVATRPTARVRRRRSRGAAAKARPVGAGGRPCWAGARAAARRGGRRRALGLAPPGTRAAADAVQPAPCAEPGAAAAADPAAARRIALSPDGRALAYVGPGPSDGASSGCGASTSSIATPIAGTEGAAEPVLLPRRPAVGFIKNGTERAHRVARRARPTGHPDRQGQHHRGRLGPRTATSTSRSDSGIARIRATGGDVEPVYKIVAGAQRGRRPSGRHVLPGAKGLCSGCATPARARPTSRSWR